jgi:hypothetical protein
MRTVRQCTYLCLHLFDNEHYNAHMLFYLNKQQQAEEQIVDGEVAFDEDIMRELRQRKEDSAGPGMYSITHSIL